jgi:NadR type nicotinamide-nucleotide adenylyltransferase
MKVGIVFGCFIPLHQGHEYLIDCALKENDALIIGVCGKDTDRGQDFIPFRDRIKLMKKIYNQPNITISVVDDAKLQLDGNFTYDNWCKWSNELFTNANYNPNENQYTWYMGEPSYYEKLKLIFPNHKIKVFDRNVNPLSGTKIRENLTEYTNSINKTFLDYLKK